MKILNKAYLNQKGLSIVEVLLALAIMGVITTAAMKLYLTQHKNYMIQDDVTTIQQNARASIDELTRHIRLAGYNLPPGLTAIEGTDTNPDTIMVTYQIQGCDNFLSARMPQPSAELKVGLDPSCLTTDDWVYIYDPAADIGEWFIITHVQPSAKHIQHRTMRLSHKYGENSLLFAMIQAKFFIDYTTDPAHPCLMVQTHGNAPVIYAEDVSDLQFRYKLKNGTTVDEPLIVDNIREVLISVDGRSENFDPELAEQQENYSQDIRIEYPGYRTRNYSSSVFLRNIGS